MIEEDFASPWDVKLLNPINTNQKKKKNHLFSNSSN